MTSPTFCAGCGASDFAEGWVDDVRYATVRWVPRPVRRRMMGFQDQVSTSRPVRAWRCRSCSRLELYAGDNDADPYGDTG